MWRRKKFTRIYEEEQKYTISSKITGAELVRKILNSKGITDVEIVKGRGILPDFYDPARRRLTLSPQHYGGSSYSGLGVAAHEAGHVIQHIEGHRPLLWRNSAIKATVFLTLPAIVFGALMILVGIKYPGLMVLFGWPLLSLGNLITLPIEMDASERVKRRLESLKVFKNLDERVGIERVIDASCAKYVDGVFTALSWVRTMIPNLIK